MGIAVHVAEAPNPIGVQPAWRFRVGQCVNHLDGKMTSLVFNRIRASNGFEIYGVRAVRVDDPQRDRIIMGDRLAPVRPDVLSCGSCRFFKAGMCLATIADC